MIEVKNKTEMNTFFREINLEKSISDEFEKLPEVIKTYKFKGVIDNKAMTVELNYYDEINKTFLLKYKVISDNITKNVEEFVDNVKNKL